MSPLVALYLRSDVPWGRLTEETYVDQEKYSAAVIPLGTPRLCQHLERIRTWNRCFSLSYFEYRQSLKDIADWGRSRIANLDLVLRNRHRLEVLRRLEHAVILPVDDDDWFATDIAESVRDSYDPQTSLISWNDAVCCPTRIEPSGTGHTCVFPREPPSDFLWTNSYAVTSLGLERCPIELHAQILDRHTTTLETLREHAPDLRHRRLPGRLAVTVKSPASLTKLKTLDSPEKLLDCVPRLLQRSAFIPPALAWAEPLVRQLEDLNCRLANSARKPPKRADHQAGIATASQARSSWLIRPLTRTNVINSVARRFGYRSYLEIGCGNNRNFDEVTVPVKIGVDPRQGGTHRMTSDDFFQSNLHTFDLIFIDGLHLEEQVLRDIENSLGVLNEGGCILVHDCLPAERAHQERERTTSAWTGDVWKAIVKTRRRPDVDLAVLNRCWGLGALLKRRNTGPLPALPPLTWDTYRTHRDELLRVLEPADFERFLAG